MQRNSLIVKTSKQEMRHFQFESVQNRTFHHQAITIRSFFIPSSQNCFTVDKLVNASQKRGFRAHTLTPVFLCPSS